MRNARTRSPTLAPSSSTKRASAVSGFRNLLMDCFLRSGAPAPSSSLLDRGLRGSTAHPSQPGWPGLVDNAMQFDQGLPLLIVGAPLP